MSKDHIYCEEQGHIDGKGISRLGSTCRVVDLYENLDDASQAIRTKKPHFQLNVDVTMMSAEEQAEAAAALLDAAERLSNSVAKA